MLLAACCLLVLACCCCLLVLLWSLLRYWSAGTAPRRGGPYFLLSCQKKVSKENSLHCDERGTYLKRQCEPDRNTSCARFFGFGLPRVLTIWISLFQGRRHGGRSFEAISMVKRRVAHAGPRITAPSVRKSEGVGYMLTRLPFKQRRIERPACNNAAGRSMN